MATAEEATGKNGLHLDLSVRCLEDLSCIEQRCQELGLAMYVVDPNNDIPKTPSEAKNSYESEFEVYAIRDYRVNDGVDWYLVQWKGWKPKYNTWEPKENLSHCPNLLKRFHEQLNGTKLKRKLVKKKRELEVDQQADSIKKLKKLCSSKIKKSKSTRDQACKKKKKKRVKEIVLRSPEPLAVVAERVVRRTETDKRLQAWEVEINRNLPSGEAPIIVINDVDFEGPPENFSFINDYKAGDGIEIPDDPLVGCECEPDCFEQKDRCCGKQSGGHFAYTRKGKLRISRGSPIYECNKRCKCGPDCCNRVVQHGRKVKLAIFRTSNGCGWGVKTLHKLKKDMFVMEYVGEVITNEEAEKRGKVYDAEGRTYLFDLDYNDGDCPFTVDAAHYGNISHFMNHSCAPNLVVYGVWINTLDPQLPRIAFFTNRDIARGEELTFDYMMSGETLSGTSTPKATAIDSEPFEGSKRIPCKCGTAECRTFLC